jgi:hypothetical protein
MHLVNIQQAGLNSLAYSLSVPASYLLPYLLRIHSGQQAGFTKNGLLVY